MTARLQALEVIGACSRIGVRLISSSKSDPASIASTSTYHAGTRAGGNAPHTPLVHVADRDKLDVGAGRQIGQVWPSPTLPHPITPTRTLVLSSLISCVSAVTCWVTFLMANGSVRFTFNSV